MHRLTTFGFGKVFFTHSYYNFNMIKFAERLKELRIEKGLSQRDLAKATDISQNAIAFWENEKRVPNANAVAILATFFGVTAGYILGLED